MKILSTALFTSLFALAALQANAAPDDAPVRTGAFVIETVDGLPIEVVLQSVFRDEVRVRNTASNRESVLSFARLDKNTQEYLTGEIEKVRKSAKTISFSVSVEENNTGKSVQLAPRGGFLDPKEALTLGQSRTLPPGERCLRIRAGTQPNTPVDLPVEVQILWYSKPAGSAAPSIARREKVTLNAINRLTEYVSPAAGIPRAAYMGYAVVVTNPANGATLWRGASTPQFLHDLK
ncbi:MAG: hypothetical protein LBV28_01975 [Puniceicoccales bacterium]|jgi:hypothetical protein|nr:hypothetical protein [Puniceicoccales bacterium]